MSTKSNIFDFIPTDAPTIIKQYPMRLHLDGETRFIGFQCRDENYKSCFLSPRKHEKHYFHKFEGYGLSDEIIDRLEDLCISTVYIYETDTGTVYQFDREQFQSGNKWTFKSGDTQRVVPVAQAVGQFDESEVIMRD